jgi:hypothetical protein
MTLIAGYPALLTESAAYNMQSETNQFTVLSFYGNPDAIFSWKMNFVILLHNRATFALFFLRLIEIFTSQPNSKDIIFAALCSAFQVCRLIFSFSETTVQKICHVSSSKFPRNPT